MLALFLTMNVFGGALLPAAPQFIGGPVLGFMPDADGTAIRPLMGIPGASVPGESLSLDADIHGAIISPKQDYAIAFRVADTQTAIIDFSANPPVATPVAGANPGAELIAVSPTGSMAAGYDRVSGTIQLIGNLPHSAAVVSAFDASLISGHATGLSISDDGTIALIKIIDNGEAGLWVVGSQGGPWRIPLDRPSAAAFFPNRHDAVITDHATHSAFLMTDIDSTATLTPLFSAADGIANFSSVSVAEDGRRVFLADARSGIITVVDVQTGTAILTSCQCRPTGLFRLSGTSIFRLTERSGQPIIVLDASSDDPRIRVIPPAPSVTAQSQ